MDVPPPVEWHSYTECPPNRTDHIVVSDGYYYQSGYFILHHDFNEFIPDDFGYWDWDYWSSTGLIHPKFLESVD